MNVLLTGGFSGIGKATKELFLKNGHTVYVFDNKKIEKEDNLFPFCVDITDKEELIRIKKDLENKCVSFDVIINIAGIHKMISLVESDYALIKKLIDINLTGTMLINHTFHSLLKEKGRIVIVTSEVATFDPMPFNGLYNVSKTALETYAQALRQELNLLNQKVITIRPGAVETPLSNNSITDTESLSKETKLYKRQSKKFVSIMKKFMGKPIKPEKISKLIYKSVIKKHPRITYSKHKNIGLILLNILPKRLQCFIIKLLLK